jgi:uncharacterized membrane protein YraQ (UPF0718 family)
MPVKLTKKLAGIFFLCINVVLSSFLQSMTENNELYELMDLDKNKHAYLI